MISTTVTNLVKIKKILSLPPNEDTLSISDIEGEGDLCYKSRTVETVPLDTKIIIEEDSNEEIDQNGGNLTSKNSAKTPKIKIDQKTQWVQTEIMNEEMRAVFDAGFQPALDNSGLNDSLEKLNKKLFQELSSFEELASYQEESNSNPEDSENESNEPQTSKNKSPNKGNNLKNYTYKFTKEIDDSEEEGSSLEDSDETPLQDGTRKAKKQRKSKKLRIPEELKQFEGQMDLEGYGDFGDDQNDSKEINEISGLHDTSEILPHEEGSYAKKKTKRLKNKTPGKYHPNSSSGFKVQKKKTISEGDPSRPGGDKYKSKFKKALKLINSLQKELSEYKKMSKIMQLLNSKKQGALNARDEMSEDIKLIISDLKEHIGLQENEELTMIKDNFGKIISLIGAQNHENTKEIEEILQNVIHCKSNKKDALGDFTDKIITTVEEVDERREEDDETFISESKDKFLQLNHSLTGFQRRASSSSVNSLRNTPRKSIDLRTKFLEFNLSKAGMIKAPRKLSHAADHLIDKILQKKVSKDLMPKSQMFMIITQIHKTSRDFLEKNHPDLSVQGYVYDYIMNKYGIKKIADKKFRQFCSTIRKFKQTNPRSYIFGRFMGIFQPLEKHKFIQYTDIKEMIHGLNIGFMPNNIESSGAHFVPYIRVTKYLSMHVENTIPQDLYKKLLRKIKSLQNSSAITMKRGKNAAGVIDFDQFILALFDLKHNKQRKNSENQS